MKYLLIVGLLFCSLQARADELEDLSASGGALCNSGVFVCPSDPWLSVSATFSWDITTESIVPDSVAVTSSSGLGPLSWIPSQYNFDSFPTIWFTDAANDTFFIGLFGLFDSTMFPPNSGGLPTVAWSAGGFLFINCALNDACETGDFEGKWYSGQWTGTTEYDPPTTQTPEPGTIALLVLPLLILMLNCSASKNHRTTR